MIGEIARQARTPALNAAIVKSSIAGGRRRESTPPVPHPILLSAGR